jgi:NAD-dependent DNA ligase
MSRVHEYLNRCAREYYAGMPSISDELFDALAESSGYNSVGARQHDNEEKHHFQMYSLQKFYEDEGKESPLKGYKDIDISPKIDGAAVDLLYLDGRFARALTRGDGIIGTVVTDKFIESKLIPQTISTLGVVQITGELAAPSHIENARNYAAGSLNLKDVEEFRTRAVTFFAYGIQPAKTNSFSKDMRFLRDQGFNTIKDPDIEKIYPCDGLVFRLNNYIEFYDLGYTAKHPRGAYALKERKEAVETTLLDVEWQVGKSGKVTPVAILEPVLVGDATVSRATLNNIAFIRALDIRIGDKVAIQKAGEIIPQVLYKVE